MVEEETKAHESLQARRQMAPRWRLPMSGKERKSQEGTFFSFENWSPARKASHLLSR
jgi:hypothetical protein